MHTSPKPADDPEEKASSRALKGAAFAKTHPSRISAGPPPRTIPENPNRRVFESLSPLYRDAMKRTVRVFSDMARNSDPGEDRDSTQHVVDEIIRFVDESGCAEFADELRKAGTPPKAPSKREPLSAIKGISLQQLQAARALRWQVERVGHEVACRVTNFERMPGRGGPVNEGPELLYIDWNKQIDKQALAAPIRAVILDGMTLREAKSRYSRRLETLRAAVLDALDTYIRLAGWKIISEPPAFHSDAPARVLDALREARRHGRTAFTQWQEQLAEPVRVPVLNVLVHGWKLDRAAAEAQLPEPQLRHETEAALNLAAELFAISR